MDDSYFSLPDHLFERTAARRSLRILVRTLLENGEDARLVVVNAGHHELRGQHALAGPRRTGDQHGVTLRDAAAEHRVELVDVQQETFAKFVLWARLVGRRDDQPRKD